MSILRVNKELINNKPRQRIKMSHITQLSTNIWVVKKFLAVATPSSKHLAYLRNLKQANKAAKKERHKP